MIIKIWKYEDYALILALEVKVYEAFYWNENFFWKNKITNKKVVGKAILKLSLCLLKGSKII